MGTAKLLSFTLANYRSFYAPQTIDLTDRNGAPRSLTVIYGPNSSGKSNTASAMQDFRSCILNSSSANWRLPYMPFMLRSGAADKPTSFDVTFSLDGRKYRYAFSFLADRVVEETLRASSPKSGRMNLVFRRGEHGIESKSASKYGFGRAIEEKTRSETLLITKAREDNNSYSAAVFSLVDSMPTMLDRGVDAKPQFVEMLKSNEDLRAKILDLLKNCDFSIRDIAIETKPIPEELVSSLPLPQEVRSALAEHGGTSFSTLHAIRDDELSIVGLGAMDFWTQESNGTRKFFEMAVPIVSALERGDTLYLDEYGAYLHPMLAKTLVSLFKSGANKMGASLIVNTQSTSLMGGVADRDDIVLVEKDAFEESHITPLKSRGARTNEPLESRYLRGYYGAIPRVRDR